MINVVVKFFVIGDVDIGYGNVFNVKWIVKGYIQVGFVGLFFEDQVLLYIIVFVSLLWLFNSFVGIIIL